MAECEDKKNHQPETKAEAKIVPRCEQCDCPLEIVLVPRPDATAEEPAPLCQMCHGMYAAMDGKQLLRIYHEQWLIQQARARKLIDGKD